MKNTTNRNRDIILGRADILLKFLQLIGKDRPSKLDIYLKDLDPELERPLVDQIVDKLIEGDKKLYKIYETAKHEVGSRNPYSSVEDISESGEQQQALGNFVANWTKFEKTLRELGK